MDTVLTDSDWESSSESGSSEPEEIGISYIGQAQNIFSSLEETIGKIDDFLAFERGFTYGDIVCSITDPTGQTGRVVNITMFVDLENVYGKVVKEVNSNKLQKIRSISVGDYVVNGAWLGRVDKVVDRVSVILDDGSKCEVTVTDQEKLVPVSPNLLEDSQYSYYPGQRVQVVSHAPKSTRWLCGNWRENQDLGTVCAVEAGLLHVDWISSIVTGSDLPLHAPPRLEDPTNLTLLSCFSHASWQLGDWCIFRVSSNKGIMEPNIPCQRAYDLFKGQKKLDREFQRNNPSSSLDELFVITKTKSKIDVIWQDGSCSSGVDTQTLLPVGAVNTHEFWPEQFVMEREISNSQRWGVVRAVDAKEQTVKVQWRSRPEKIANGFSENQIGETVSAYELVEHPDFQFCFNDLVFRVLQNQPGEKPGDNHSNAEISMVTEAGFEDKKCEEGENACPGTRYLSCIGVVTGFKDGAVEVKWANGFTTKVAPYEIYRIEKTEGSATATLSFDENGQELNHKISVSDDVPSIQQGKDLMSFMTAGENCNHRGCESNSFSLPRAAIGFLTNVAASLFGLQGSMSLSNPVSCSLDSQDQNESENLIEEEVMETFDLSKPNPVDSCAGRKSFLKEEGSKTSKETGKKLVGFRQFDMVNDCSDHHFLASRKELAQSQVKRSWVKKVQQEWSILEANLPDTIYVRVYEERMDLMRAALVGAPGTPYHDGLFFFDILLPPQYPHEPPMVHYNSGGLRVNPNLYESGKVCLSLLNTWSGTGSEIWNPGASSVLQVLLSLQALVLNEKPYFNEAGYDQQMGRAEGEKNSVSYNENAFLVTCKSMLYLLRKPPKHFETLVEEHFAARAQHILSACKAYMEGAPVGSADDMHQNSDGSSKGFKIMLGKLFPKLVEAFSDIGVDCSQAAGLNM